MKRSSFLHSVLIAPLLVLFGFKKSTPEKWHTMTFDNSNSSGKFGFHIRGCRREDTVYNPDGTVQFYVNGKLVYNRDYSNITDEQVKCVIDNMLDYELPK